MLAGAAGAAVLALALLRQAYDQHGSWTAAITNVSFPDNDENGTSQQDYLHMVDGLHRELNAAG